MTSRDLVVERIAPNVLLVRRHGESFAGLPSPPAGVSVVVTSGAGALPVGDVLAELALDQFVLVPGKGVATHAWLAEVALRLGRDVEFSTGLAGFHPFPVLLNQPERGGDQSVLSVVPAPPGWTLDGTVYRAGDVVAEVVPSGVVVRSADGTPADGVLPFSPAGWTLYVGVPGEPVSLPVVVAAERLLDWVGPDQRTFVKARVLGELEPEARDALLRNVQRFRTPAAPQPALKPEPPTPAPVTPPASEPAPEPKAEPVIPAVFAAMPSILTMSSAPVSTVSNGAPAPPKPAPEPEEPPAPSGQPDQPSAGTQPPPAPPSPPAPSRQPDQHSAGTQPPLAGPPAPPTQPEPPEQSGPPAQPLWPTQSAPPELSGSLAQPAPHVQPGPPAQPASQPAPPSQPTHPPHPVTGPLSIPDRGSTTNEQTRFTAAAGGAFGEALAAVNAALATWPSLRQDSSAGFKADLVAVCLYLSQDEAMRVNAAVRQGQPSPVDAHIPCLASGIRRLPTHRRAVLRQSVLPDATTPGTLLTEPGFLTASMDLDITVPGAEVDVLIWPASARRTAELLSGRPVNEAVFIAGARFKALGVRTTDDREETDGPAAPRVAVLFRELAPSEQHSGTELDDRDKAVLEKLDRILANRLQRPLRLVDEPGVVGRLTTSLVEWQAIGTTAAAS